MTADEPRGAPSTYEREGSRLDLLRWRGHEAREAGWTDLAIPAYRTAADAGDVDALRWAVHLLEAEERVAEAVAWLERRAEGGDVRSWWLAAGVLVRAGHAEAAVPFFTRAGEAGGPKAFLAAGDHLRRAGCADAAAALFRRGADRAESPTDLLAAARARVDVSHVEAGVAVAGPLAEDGDVERLRQFVWHLSGKGHREHCIRLLRRGVARGASPLRPHLVELLFRDGREDEAYACGLEGLAGNDVESGCRLLRELVDRGRIDAALDVCRLPPLRDDPRPVAVIARQLSARSSWTAVVMERLAEEEEAGPVPALRLAAAARAAQGDHVKASALYRQAAEAGDDEALEPSPRRVRMEFNVGAASTSPSSCPVRHTAAAASSMRGRTGRRGGTAGRPSHPERGVAGRGSRVADERGVKSPVRRAARRARRGYLQTVPSAGALPLIRNVSIALVAQRLSP
ncbi:hypothetical protein [Streptomyces spectabilis]|uniref:TPR repeat protein n=1 Tax=Streptomyces spectabilis TaxID=68270 RepID=A0A5P2X2Y5_STRST|nr:hypothetical protein [Streptomyces spectabilis]MBB5107328.1 TPR repeat protein [Streptomyces spectabilis]MCI3900019.1 hypothetical protein [Streptomyces spectabilis]QEV57649.1 hypothetical protein CP982_02085 [Streptomyces spectabilis]